MPWDPGIQRMKTIESRKMSGIKGVGHKEGHSQGQVAQASKHCPGSREKR